MAENGLPGGLLLRVWECDDIQDIDTGDQKNSEGIIMAVADVRRHANQTVVCRRSISNDRLALATRQISCGSKGEQVFKE